MANKCGVPYDELEDDAYGLLERFDALSVAPDNRFTANDVAAALEAFEGGSAAGRSRRYTQGFCERKAAVSYGEKMGHGSNPPDKRLPRDLSLEKARMTRDLNQRASGTNWWDNGNRDGAPTKAIQVWNAATENPGLSMAALARIAGVSRPTVYKWLTPGWQTEYKKALNHERRSTYQPGKVMEEQTEQFKHRYANDRLGLVQAVLRHVASHPWEPYEQTAVFFGLTSVSEVERIVRENGDLLNQIKIGIDDERRVWNSETDDYFDALMTADLMGKRSDLMKARALGVHAAIEWARHEAPGLFEETRAARSAGRTLTADDLAELKEKYIHSI